MIQVFQAEWCPYSHAVRQRLTEKMVPFAAIPVEPDPEDREAMEQATGERSIPVVVLEDGTVLAGDTDAILERLGELFPDTDHTAAHHERRFEARMFERA